MRLFYQLIKQSLNILIIVTVLSAIGGITIEMIKSYLFVITPLLILFPILNNMLGSIGSIVSSKFTTLLYLGKIDSAWWKSKHFFKLVKIVFLVNFLSIIYVNFLIHIFSWFKGDVFDLIVITKIFIMSLVITFVITILVLTISFSAGFYIYNHRKDPDNYLTPLAHAISDLGSMIIFSLFVWWWF